MSNKRFFWIVLIILGVLAFSLRAVYLSADPPTSLSASAGEFGDPGGYAFNARNKVLFGEWEIDLLNPMYLTLIPHSVTYVVFKIFGVGLAQMNSVPLFFALLSLFILTLIVRKEYGDRMAFLALLFLGANYVFIMYSRIGNRIMPMLFFLVLSLFFLQKGTQKKGYLFFAGLMGFLAFITKGVCLYILAGFFAGLLLYLLFNHRIRDTIQSFGLFLGGFIVGFIPWYFVIYTPYSYVFEKIATINEGLLVPPKEISGMLAHFWTRPAILSEHMPVLLVAGGVSLLFLLFKIVRQPKTISLLEWILTFWYLGGAAYFAIIYQRVTRHFVPQIIPLVFFLIWMFQSRNKLAEHKFTEKIPILYYIVMFCWLCFPVSLVLRNILKGSSAEVWAATSILGVTCAALTGLFFALLKLVPKIRNFAVPAIAWKWILPAVAVVFLLSNGMSYIRWVTHPQFKLKTVSQDLGKALDNAVIAGLWGPIISMENTHRAHEFYPDYINDDENFLRDKQVTHVFASDFFGGEEEGNYWRHFRPEMSTSRKIARFPMWRGHMTLYSLDSETEGENPGGILEAELFTEHPGIPRFMEDASNRYAIWAPKGNTGIVFEAIPDQKFEAGTYKVILFLKIDKSSGTANPRVAKIDVFSESLRRRNLKSVLFTEDQIQKYGQFSEVTFLFRIPRTTQLRLRLQSFGEISFWVDRIQIQNREQKERGGE
ncbi:ArnT family glycosyltransferase [Acidobacteriota bacterium]